MVGEEGRLVTWDGHINVRIFVSVNDVVKMVKTVHSLGLSYESMKQVLQSIVLVA